MTYYENRPVCLTDEHGHELEVYLDLLDEGFYLGVWCDGPNAGVEVELTSEQVKEARKIGYESTYDGW